MKKSERYDLYKGSVLPGWWALLDKHMARIFAIDPACEIYLKEKFATLRIHVASENHDWKDFHDIEVDAEHESAGTCEYCGQSGSVRRNRSYLVCLCDNCAKLRADNTKNKVIQATERKWLEEAPEEI